MEEWLAGGLIKPYTRQTLRIRMFSVEKAWLSHVLICCLESRSQGSFFRVFGNYGGAFHTSENMKMFGASVAAPHIIDGELSLIALYDEERMSKVHALLKLTAVIARYLCFLVFRNNKFLTVLWRILGVSSFDRPCYVLLSAIVIVEV